MTLSTERQVTMATPTDCLACPSTVPASEADTDGDVVDTFHVSQFDPLPVTAEQVRRETRRDYRPDHPRWISGRVSAKEGLHNQVEVYPGTHWRRHIDQIRPTAANPETPPVPTAANPETPLVLTALSQPSTPDTAEYSPEESTESQSEQELCSESAVEECVTERQYPLRDRKPVVRMNL